MATSLLEQIKPLLVALAADAPKSSSMPEEEWLTIQETVNRYKISRWTLRRMRLDGRIIAKKVSKTKSGKVLISKNSMDLWLAAAEDIVGRERV